MLIGIGAVLSNRYGCSLLRTVANRLEIDNNEMYKSFIRLRQRYQHLWTKTPFSCSLVFIPSRISVSIEVQQFVMLGSR